MSFKANCIKHWMVGIFVLAELCLPANLRAEAKSFLFTLPLLTVGREGAIRGEYNLYQKAGLALEWAQWNGKGEREELTNDEIRDNPGSSLITEGRDIGVMFSRYSDPKNLGGWNWGLGAGYRTVTADWTRTPSLYSKTDDTNAHYNVNIKGATVSGRVGYRFVGDNVGFAIGTFLGLKHFLGQVSDISHDESAGFQPISQRDRRALQQKLATSLKLGLEIGWAF